MEFLSEIAESTVSEFRKNALAKIRDANTFKLNLGAHDKSCYTSYPIHKMVFGKAFGRNFRPYEGVYPSFEIKTLERFMEVFGSKTVVKFNHHGDLALASPVDYLDKSYSIHDRGDLLIPVREVNDDNVLCFFPAGADETDKLIALSSVVIYEKGIVPEKVQEGFTLTIKKGKHVDYVSIPTGHNLVEGDELIVRGKSYTIIGISEDDASTFEPNTRSVIRVDRDFANNCTRQKLRYRKKPMLSGTLTELPKGHLIPYHRVQFLFKENMNGNNHGVLDVSFKNMIFNSDGVLTHDRAISVAPEAS